MPCTNKTNKKHATTLAAAHLEGRLQALDLPQRPVLSRLVLAQRPARHAHVPLQLLVGALLAVLRLLRLGRRHKVPAQVLHLAQLLAQLPRKAAVVLGLPENLHAALQHRVHHLYQPAAHVSHAQTRRSSFFSFPLWLPGSRIHVGKGQRALEPDLRAALLRHGKRPSSENSE
jgi:hypothetical protein